MVSRSLMARLREDLDQFPAVGLLGPRQAGKTTLALAVAADRPSLYLDLESPSDLAKLEDAEAFLGRQQDRLVILDEVHRAPALFPLLRGLIDRARRPWRCGGCGRCWPTARAGCSTWRTWPRPAA